MMNVSEIIDRMIKASGAKNMTEMLSFMGFSHGAGSTWKRRGEVPDGSIAKVAESTGVDFKWLKTGQGEMRPAPRGDKIIFSATTGGNTLTPDESRLLAAYRKLDPTRREQIRAIMEDLANCDTKPSPDL